MTWRCFEAVVAGIRRWRGPVRGDRAAGRRLRTNYTKYGQGIGTAVYWFMGGPGVDPGYNGYWSYLGTHSGYKAGVYSDQAIWTQIFGTGSAASIPHTYEWTYEPETASLAEAPPGWCLKSGGCAEFFGGVTRSSPFALMWQWSGGAGVRNAIGDFDQIDASRQT